MKIVGVDRLTFPEVAVIRFARFQDHRGYFTEHYRESDFADLDFLRGVHFRQMNESFSRAGTIRGLHFQWDPYQGKLVRAVTGRLIDLAHGHPQGLADVRPDHRPRPAGARRTTITPGGSGCPRASPTACCSSRTRWSNTSARASTTARARRGSRRSPATSTGRSATPSSRPSSTGWRRRPSWSASRTARRPACRSGPRIPARTISFTPRPARLALLRSIARWSGSHRAPWREKTRPAGIARAARGERGPPRREPRAPRTLPRARQGATAGRDGTRPSSMRSWAAGPGPFVQRARRFAAAVGLGTVLRARGFRAGSRVVAQAATWCDPRASAPARPTASGLKVSVIIPNYNHAPYIEERLRSVFAQTYPPHEVLFLDDASSDESLAVARRLTPESPVPVRFVLNESNSGSPFRQWLKGIDLARGDLVWIAESDDTCRPDLLERLVAPFDDPDVMLAYCQSAMIGPDGRPFAADYLAATEDLSPVRWRYSILRPGARGSRAGIEPAQHDPQRQCGPVPQARPDRGARGPGDAPALRRLALLCDADPPGKDRVCPRAAQWPSPSRRDGAQARSSGPWSCSRSSCRSRRESSSRSRSRPTRWRAAWRAASPSTSIGRGASAHAPR